MPPPDHAFQIMLRPTQESRPAPASAPQEPSPREILNPHGAAPMLVICDHASRAIPRRYANLGLDQALLERHIAWDVGAREVSARLAATLDAPLVAAGFSRLLIDPNRQPGHPTSIPAVSEDIIIPGNQDLGADEARRRANAFFWPYHDAIRDMLARFEARGISPVIISVHSFTPIFHGVERPWHIGILWHEDGRIAVPLIRRLRQLSGLLVGDNEPYHGGNPAGYSIQVHAEAPGHPHVLIELRQDLLGDDAGAEWWAETLAGLLGQTVRELEANKREEPS